MAPPPGSPDIRSAPSPQVLSSRTAKENSEKPTTVPGAVCWARETKLLNPWGKKSGAGRLISSGKSASTSATDAVGAAGAGNKPETKAASKQPSSADASNNTDTGPATGGTNAPPGECTSVSLKTKPSEIFLQQKVDIKHAPGTGNGVLSFNQQENSSAVPKNANEAKDPSDAGSMLIAALTPTSSTAKPEAKSTNATNHLLVHSNSPPEAAHEELLRSLHSPTDKSTINRTSPENSNNTVNDATDSSTNSNFDNPCAVRSVKAFSSGALETPTTTEKRDFFGAGSVETASLENLAAKLRSFSFHKPTSNNGSFVNSSSSSISNSRGPNTSTAATYNSSGGGDVSDGNSSVLLSSASLKSSHMLPADAASCGGTLPNGHINATKQLKDTLFPLHRCNMVLSTALRDPAYASAALAAHDVAAAEAALAFPLEHSRQQQNSRDCAFDPAPGASAIAAAAVLAQQESRPLLLTRFEMLEAYAKGRLCLSCDSKSHRMPSCPYGEFVCPNCHRSSHRGEECPLRCRFCQNLHVGVSVTVCIKRFRGPLEALLGIPLPLRDLQPASLLSSGSPLSPFGPAACTRPNSAFGRSVYLSNLPPNTTQEAVAAAVESLVTKGRILQVDLHEKHAFVQLSTLEAAFELVDKRRQLQIRGVTLKVQFKKTGVFNNALPQGTGAGAFVGGGVMHPSGSSTNSGFSLSSAGCSSTNAAGAVTNPSTPTPLSAASSPTGGAFATDSVTPRISPSLNSLLIFLGPPAAPYVSEICAQVAAKLREDLQLGLVSAQQQSQQSLVSGGSVGMQIGSDSLQLKQLQAQFEEPLATPLTRSLLSISGSSSNSNVSSVRDKNGGSGAAGLTGSPTEPAGSSSSEGPASALLSYGLTQNKSRALGSDSLQRRQLPYMDAAAASAAALLQQQQQLLALSRQQQQQKTAHALSTEKILLQLLQQQQLEQQQQQQLAQQQHRYALGQRDDSSSSPPAQDVLLTETLMRAAAAATAGRCIQATPDRTSNEAYNARQNLQLQLRQQEQLQDLQQQQQRQQRLLQLGCSSTESVLDAATQEQQLHQRPRQAADLGDMMGLSHYPVYPEGLGKSLTTDSLVALGLASSQSDASVDQYAGTAEGSTPGTRTKGGVSNTTNHHSSSTGTGSGIDLQYLLSAKNTFTNELSSSAASPQACYSRADATPLQHSTSSNVKSNNASSTDGSVAFAALQHPWNELAAAAAAALPAKAGGNRLSALSSSTCVSSHPQPLQPKEARMRLQELQQQPLAHSSSTPLSTTTATFAEGDSVYKRLSPQHFIEGPSTISTDSGGLLSSSTAARLVAAADEKAAYGTSKSNGSKDFDSSKNRSVGKAPSAGQHGFAAACDPPADSTAAGLSSSASTPAAGAEDLCFQTKKQVSPAPRVAHGSEDQETERDADSGASSSVAAGAGVAAAAAAGAKGQATQQLLDVAAVLMRKAMEETPDVEELARQLYHATQDLPHETVQQLLLTLASNGWGGAGATPTEEEEGEEEEGGAEERNRAGTTTDVASSSTSLASASYLV